MVIYLSNPYVIAQQQIVTVNNHAVCVVDGDREETRPLRPAKVVQMRSVNTSLRKKAHEKTSDLDRDFSW